MCVCFWLRIWSYAFLNPLSHYLTGLSAFSTPVSFCVCVCVYLFSYSLFRFDKEYFPELSDFLKFILKCFITLLISSSVSDVCSIYTSDILKFCRISPEFRVVLYLEKFHKDSLRLLRLCDTYSMYMPFCGLKLTDQLVYLLARTTGNRVSDEWDGAWEISKKNFKQELALWGSDILREGRITERKENAEGCLRDVEDQAFFAGAKICQSSQEHALTAWQRKLVAGW